MQESQIVTKISVIFWGSSFNRTL